jgi:hypothetical protein
VRMHTRGWVGSWVARGCALLACVRDVRGASPIIFLGKAPGSTHRLVRDDMVIRSFKAPLNK